MTFQPVVPFAGIAGWTFLTQTRDTQEAAFRESPALDRQITYFEENIGKITSAQDLVDDRQLMQVALGAFGLDDDIDAKAYIREVLDQGTIDPESLANRLSDKRYLAMSEAFGFDLSPPNTQLSSFASEITTLYRNRQFEVAVGNAQPDMRTALALDRDLGGLLERELSDEANWFTIMATPSLRTVFEKAFSLPITVGTLNLDRQLELFREKAAAFFGDTTVAQFSDPEKLDSLRDRFLAQSELQNVGFSPTTRGSAALALLQGSAGTGGLIL
ncbi:MAG: DUF1217 domain-containing protein [Pseudomonadota bacterium]